MNGTMLENGLDFILDSANKLKEAEETNDDTEKNHAIKYSLLHLLSGIELVMKARLYIENWAYIFADINKADKNKLKTGELLTVEYSKCIERLEKLCGIRFSDDEKTAFDDLRRKRNCVEHFKATDSVDAISASINRALSATLNFLNENNEEFESPSVIDLREKTDKGLSDKENMLLEAITHAVSALAEHRDEAIKMADSLADKQGCCLEEDRIICPSCKERFLISNYRDKKCRCTFCGYEKNAADAARDYLLFIEGKDEYREEKDGGVYPLYVCPDCGCDSFVLVGNSYRCFGCGVNYSEDEISFCSECGEPYSNSDEEYVGLCTNCIEYKLLK